MVPRVATTTRPISWWSGRPAAFNILHRPSMSTRTKPNIFQTYPPGRESMPKEVPRGSPPGHPPKLIATCLDVISRLSGKAKIFAECLLITGARPQELLQLTMRDVDQRGMVYIRSLKRGRSRVALCPPILQLTQGGARDDIAPLFGTFTYKQFYRAVDPLLEGPGILPHVHRPVGRLFRRAYASGNHALAASDLAAVSLSLGHKTKSSTLYYLEGGDLTNGKNPVRHPG